MNEVELGQLRHDWRQAAANHPKCITCKYAEPSVNYDREAWCPTIGRMVWRDTDYCESHSEVQSDDEA